MVERNHNFLKKKYNEFLLPTLLMVMSEKICSVVDVLVLSMLMGSSMLSATSISMPFIYFSGLIYVLFGQGGSLLALRSKAKLNNEKSNFYFTFSIIGSVVIAVIYVLILFVFTDNILYLFNTPESIFQYSKDYMFVIFYIPLNVYIVVMSYFVRSDGFPKLTFFAVLISNVLNLIFDVIFINVFNLGIKGAALASIIGYAVGAIFITLYYFRRKRGFNFEFKFEHLIKESVLSFKEILFNTPEIVGKLFFSIKMTFYTYLCSTYLGVVGLLAFIIYDNSETFVNIFFSGFMKTMSPIVAVFYKESDYDAVEYIIVRSFRQLIIVLIPITLIFLLYPDILLMLFNFENHYEMEVASLAIRITSLGLVGRCLTYLLANYAQAIEQNRFVVILFSLNEFIVPIFGGLALTNLFGAIGIWISLTLAELTPVIVHVIYSHFKHINYEDELGKLLLLHRSNLVVWTYYREDMGGFDKNDLDGESRDMLIQIEKHFHERVTLDVSKLINDVCVNIFNNDPDLEQLDITVNYNEEILLVSLTAEGEIYNPLVVEKIKQLQNYDCLKRHTYNMEYETILGFNKFYLKVYS